MQGLRRELRRVGDAYASLVRDTRAHKTLWEAREKALQNEITRLKTASSSDKTHVALTADLRATLRTQRAQLDEARATIESLTLRCDERTRARDSAQASLRAAQERIATLTSEASSAGAAASARAAADVAAARARAADAVRERDALLEYVEEARRERAELLSAASEGRTASALYDTACAEATAARKRVSELEPLVSEIALLRPRAAAADAAEAVAARLRGELNAADEALEEPRSRAESAEAKVDQLEGSLRAERAALARSERMLEDYRRIERAFAERTGAGFLGPDGLGFQLGVGTRGRVGMPYTWDPDPLAASSAAASLAAASAAASDGGSSSSLLPPSPLVEYLTRLRASVTAELRSAADSAAAERIAAATAATEAAEARCRDLSASLLDARRAAAEVTEWRRRVESAEDEVAALLASAATASPAAQAAVLSSEWHALPSFAAVLPRLAAAVARLRTELSSALRGRRVAEAEAADLRQEVTALQAELMPGGGGRSAAAVTADVRASLTMLRVERDKLKADLVAAGAATSDAVNAAAAASARIARYKSRVLRARELLSQRDAAIASVRIERDAAAAEATRLTGEAAMYKTKWADAAAMTSEALRVIAERDADVASLQLRLRGVTQAAHVASDAGVPAWRTASAGHVGARSVGARDGAAQAAPAAARGFQRGSGGGDATATLLQQIGQREQNPVPTLLTAAVNDLLHQRNGGAADVRSSSRPFRAADAAASSGIIRVEASPQPASPASSGTPTGRRGGPGRTSSVGNDNVASLLHANEPSAHFASTSAAADDDAAAGASASAVAASPMSAPLSISTSPVKRVNSLTSPVGRNRGAAPSSTPRWQDELSVSP